MLFAMCRQQTAVPDGRNGIEQIAIHIVRVPDDQRNIVHLCGKLCQCLMAGLYKLSAQQPVFREITA